MIARSFKLGAVRLTDRFFSTAALHPSAVGSCRAFVRSTLMVLQSEMAELGHEIAVASSGTAETVAKLIHARSGNAEPKTMNRFAFSGKDISETVKQLASTSTVEERQKMFNLKRVVLKSFLRAPSSLRRSPTFSVFQHSCTATMHSVKVYSSTRCSAAGLAQKRVR